MKFKSTSLPKGTYVKLRPQSKDFLDITNPKAVCVPLRSAQFACACVQRGSRARTACNGVRIRTASHHLLCGLDVAVVTGLVHSLETTLRKYSCLTTGDSILINYNNKRYFIDIFETKPQRAVTIIEVRGPRPLPPAVSLTRFAALAARARRPTVR